MTPTVNCNLSLRLKHYRQQTKLPAATTRKLRSLERDRRTIYTILASLHKIGCKVKCEIVGPLPVSDNHQSNGQTAQIPNLERTETIMVNKHGPAATLSTMEVLNVAISIVFGTRAAMKASKHILDGTTFRAILATTIAISGTTTIVNATESLSCLDETQVGRISGGATTRIVHVQDKIIATAAPATLIAIRISTETETSAIRANRRDIKEEVQGVMLTDILTRISVINVDHPWRNTADGQAKISANMKIWSAGAFVSVILHLRGQIVT
jgi:hypothetical protein